MKTKSRRKWLALLMALVMLTGSLPVTAFAGGLTHSENSYVTVNSPNGENKEAEISQNEGNEDVATNSNASVSSTAPDKEVATNSNTNKANTVKISVQTPPDAEYDPVEWDISKSKEATNLDENFESQVSLSLPSAEENLASDIVFVLDGSSSTNTNVVGESMSLLYNLKQSTEDNGAAVNVCIVKFKRRAFKSDWYDLATNYDNIESAMETKYSGGTNIHAGLLAGKEALEEHTDVSANRKYLILISDGSTYLYSKDGDWESDTPFTRSYYTKENYKASAGGYWDNGLYEPNNFSDVNVPRPKTTSDVTLWRKYLKDVEERNAESNGDDYDYHCNYDLNFNQGIPSEDFKSQPCEKRTANNRDMAFYYADYVWQQIKNAGYNAYSIATKDGMAGAGNADDSHCFMNYLNEGERLNFSDINNDILFAVDAGSTVEDEMGSEFKFAGLGSVTLKVGEDTLSGTINGNTITFAHGDKANAHEITYASDSNAFRWKINENVSNFAPVKLTYTVKLANPKSTPGTYGNYDRFGNENDGTEGYGLYTNNRATLTPVDSRGEKRAPEDFKKPTVSYTVEAEPEKETGGNSGSGSDDYGYGNLTVKKMVSGTAGDTEKAFTFTIKLDHSLNGSYGDMTFEKGTATIKLKHGESSTAKYLPSGVHYSVMESDNEGYTVKAVGADGIIADGKTVVASFTNTKDAALENTDNPKTPDAPNTSDTPDEPDKPARPTDSAPKTGDESHTDFWFTLMVLSFAAFAGVCIYGKKRRHTGHDGRK